MRRSVLRCLLFAFLFVSAAVPASAGTIVGSFYFEEVPCDTDFDPTCKPFEIFNLINFVGFTVPDAPAELTFHAQIQLNGSPYGFQFTETEPIGDGGSLITNGLVPSPLLGGGVASLIFTGGNFADFGTLRLLNDVSSTSLSASVEFTANANAVPEAPSWFVIVVAFGALVAGRSFLT
jgi:hypothetical protein